VSRIKGSRAHVRTSERMVAAELSIRKAWDSLDIGWTFDDLIVYLDGAEGYESIPEDVRGKALGLAAGLAMAAVEQDRDRRRVEVEGEPGATFEVEKSEEGVIAPNGGDRLWGTLNGNRYCVVVSRDPVGEDDLRWHISVSAEAHLATGHDVPTWREFVTIVHQLRPGIAFCVPVPPRNQWMNKNPNVLHVVETKDGALIADWRRQGEAVRGTEAGVPS
jgi:hypothetical protein